MNALPPSGFSPSRAWAAAAARTPRHNPARAGCPPGRALGTRSSPSLPPLQARHLSALRPPLRGRLSARGRRRCPPAAPRPAEEERPPPWPFPLQPPPPPRGPVAAGHGRAPGASGAAAGGRAAAGKAGAGAVGARGGCPGRAAARRGGPDPLRSAPPADGERCCGCAGGSGRQRSSARRCRILGLTGTRPAGRRGLLYRRARPPPGVARRGPGHREELHLHPPWGSTDAAP